MINNLWRKNIMESINKKYDTKRRRAYEELEIRKNKLNENLITKLNKKKSDLEDKIITIDVCMYFNVLNF